MSLTNNFELEKVHNVYDIISKHFSTTRKIIWPKVQDFINTFRPNSSIIETGCGNGKNMGTRKDCMYVGLDTCENLINHLHLHLLLHLRKSKKTYHPLCDFLAF